MIVSQFWLPVRYAKKSPPHQFEVMVTNLEPVALRFGFRFVATQSVGLSDHTSDLRDHVKPLNNAEGYELLDLVQRWTRTGRFYTTRWAFPIGAGETRRTGIEMALPLEAGPFIPDVFEPGGVLRGHWELTLPAITAPSATVPRAQLARPVRVLIAALHRVRQSDGEGGFVHDNSWPLPLAAGRAEHLVPPDPPSTSTGVAGTRAAKPKAGRRRPR